MFHIDGDFDLLRQSNPIRRRLLVQPRRQRWARRPWIYELEEVTDTSATDVALRTSGECWPNEGRTERRINLDRFDAAMLDGHRNFLRNPSEDMKLSQPQFVSISHCMHLLWNYYIVLFSAVHYPLESARFEAEHLWSSFSSGCSYTSRIRLIMTL